MSPSVTVLKSPTKSGVKSRDVYKRQLFALIEKLGVKNGIILWPLRVALSGKAFTPGGAIELGYILGKDESVARSKKGIEKLANA